MASPVLYVFAISHYCEKARWALDHLGIAYTPRYLAPGAHRRLIPKLTGSGSSLPALQAGDEIVHGSSAIIDWAETNSGEGGSLQPLDDGSTAREKEKRLDDILGVHIRRYWYSEALVAYPGSVRAIFVHDLNAGERALTTLIWPLVRRLMMKGMDLGPSQFFESRDIVTREMDWLDGLLADGREYLAGERLSRLDITAAALLSPLALPGEHEAYQRLYVPAKVQRDLDEWGDRPGIRWARNLYKKHRYPQPAGESAAM